MGKEKKHKRHKSDRKEKYEDLPGGRASSSSSGSGLRLVLKVGLTPDSEPSPATPPPSVVAPLRLSMAAITEAAESHRKEKKHKKKKKKDKERDREHREKHRLKKERRLAEAAYATCTEDSTSRLSSSTEPFSQSTASSPEPASVPPPAPAAEPEQWRPPEPPRDPSPSPANPTPAYEGGDGDGPEQMEEDGDEQGCEEGGQVEEEEDEAGDSLSRDVAMQRDERDHGDGDGRDGDYDDEHDSHRRDRDHKHRRDRHDRHRASYGDDYEESPAHHHQESSRDYDSSRNYDESYEHRSHSRHHDTYPSHDEPQPKLQYDPAVAEAAANAGAYASENAQEEPVKTSLQRFLEYLLRGLEKRDTQRFFRAPVTDLLAPGYSNVIRHPMDFSTMREKVHANMYSTVAEFQNDFRLMCTNAMAYNRPDTIYFKAGKKLLHVGTKMLSPEKLMTLRTVVPAMLELSPEVLGFEVLPPPLPADAAPHGTHISSQNFSAPEPVDEDAEAEEILKQVQEAARKAAEKVAKSKNAPQLGYLRRQADGTTTLAVLTPVSASAPASAEDDDDDDDEDEGEEKEHPDKPFSHGVMVGRLSYGSPYMASFRDDRRSRAKTAPGTPGAKPTTPSSTAGSSFGPWYDPKFSSVTKEEADLLAQTYGGETAQQYASSVRRFTEDCQLATRMVDNLLDILTDGRHRRARYRLDQHRHVAGEERAVNFALATAVPPAAAPPGPNVDLGQLRTLSELGIDVRFVDALEEEERRYREAQVRLQHTSEMLLSLSEMQRRRLHVHPEIGGPPPTQSETELAETLAGNLTWMTRQAAPGDAASAKRTLPSSGPSASSPDNPGSHEEVDVEAVSSTATPEVVR